MCRITQQSDTRIGVSARLNLTAAVQENVQDLNKHVSLFDGISKRYFDTRSDEALFDLNRAVKAIGKTAEVLSKSIARFKL